MSEARMLTEKQQRKALSNAKKKKKKAPLRNVYGHPRKQNWPVLSGEDERIVLNHLLKLLRHHPDLTKEKNITALKSATSSSKISTISPAVEAVRNQIVVGLREVTVEIEKGNLKSVLLAQEVDPPSLGYLVGHLAEARNIPFAAVSNLKSCFEELLGFKSWCVGFKASSKDFDLICEKVKRATENLGEVKNQQKTPIYVEGAEQSSSTSTSRKRVNNISELHLYRTDKSKRMFVPGTVSSQDNSESSFLSFSKDTTGDAMYQKAIPSKPGSMSSTMRKLTSKKPSQPARYFDKVELLPLQVKRFQENPNKQKWKKSNNRSLENGQQPM